MQGQEEWDCMHWLGENNIEDEWEETSRGGERMEVRRSEGGGLDTNKIQNDAELVTKQKQEKEKQGSSPESGEIFSSVEDKNVGRSGGVPQVREHRGDEGVAREEPRRSRYLVEGNM